MAEVTKMIDSPPPQPQRSYQKKDDNNISVSPPTNRRRASSPPLNHTNKRRDRDRDRERERDRDSGSPGYHHRRERRDSPPPFKRSRRGEEERRRSPRDDRRFGYDYERNGGGGRGGYADERSHGRFMNRNGPSDWDSGRGGFNDAPNTGGMQREGLMSYKLFIQELEDDILPSEAERRYQEYRSEYISTQKRAYFDTHKDEEWLKNKYHPTNLLTVIERRNEHAQKIAKDFLQDLQSGTFDLGPGVTAIPASKSGQASEPNSEDEADVGGKRRRHGRAPAKESDLVSAAPKAHPVSSEPRRIQADIEQSQDLVRKLDNEKGIKDNLLWGSDQDSSGPIIIKWGSSSVKGLEGVELLDTLLTYLWRIHGVDYYGMIETNEAKGLRHVRTDSKNNDESNFTGSDWGKKLDSFWQGRIRGQDPLEIMTAKEKIDEAAAEALEPHVRKIRDEKYGWKYGCGAKGCTKLFHAAEFVHKHLKLKHTDLMMELTSKVREDIYHENYMKDSNAPGGTPIMQQPMQREKPSQRRGRPAISDIRNREERGSRNVHDRLERANVDRSDNSPHNTDDQQDGNPNDPSYDNAFGGQGISFPSDMPPPPVLMPVPGAGPLGPFIPAPPEVAMRMLREQGGGPSPFESGGKMGRNGPQVGATPGPIISGGFLQDPRRLRNYQDLDAPDDEVTVIDYRSL